MHRPVGPALLTELAGPVERVDDPHAPCAEAGGIIDALLGEDGVVRTLLGEQRHEQLVAHAIALVAKTLGVLEAQFEAKGHERSSGDDGAVTSQLMVGIDNRRFPPHDVSLPVRFQL